MITRLILAAGFASLAGWAGVSSLDRLEAASFSGLDETEFRAVLAESLPATASAAWYEGLADRAIRAEPPETAIAISALDQAALLVPQDAEIRARLAHAYLLAGEGRIDAAVSALDESYRLKPHAGREFRRWRLGLINSAWSQMPDSLRQAAIEEARVEPLYWTEEVIPNIALEL
jgi:hypothetical protein